MADAQKPDPLATLAALPVEKRRLLRHDDPLLDALADHLDPSGLLKAVKNHGEASQSHQVSSAGARGVMQFIPSTAQQYGLTDPTDPLASIVAGHRYLTAIKDQLGTDNPLVIAAAYNAGENHPAVRGADFYKLPDETQKYVSRIAARTGNSLVSFAPRPPVDLAALDPRGKTAPTPAQVAAVRDPNNPGVMDPTVASGHYALENTPSDVMGIDLGPVGRWLRNTAAAAGADTMRTVRGVKQMFNGATQAEVDDARRRDVALNEGSSGIVGNIGSQLGQAYLLNRGARVAGSRLPAAMPGLAALRNPMGLVVQQAAQAGALGALRDVSSGETRAGNAALDAGLAGATTGGLRMIERTLGHSLPYIRDAEARRLAARASQLDVPLRSNQVQEGLVPSALAAAGRMPGAGKDAADLEQARAFTRALSRTIEQDTHNIRDAVRNARPVLGREFEDIGSRNPIHITGGDLGDMNQIIPNTGGLADADKAVIQDYIDRIMTSYRNNVNANGGNFLPGTEYQNLRSQMERTRGGAAQRGNNDLAQGLKQLRVIFDNAAERSIMAPEDVTRWTQLRGLWGNMRTLEAAQNLTDPSGLVSPRRLAVTMASTRPANAANRAALQGATPNTPERRDLTDLTQVGMRFLPDAVPNSAAHDLGHISTPAALGAYAAEKLDLLPSIMSSFPLATAAAGGYGALAALGRYANSPVSAYGAEAFRQPWMRSSGIALRNTAQRLREYGAPGAVVGMEHAVRNRVAPPEPGAAAADRRDRNSLADLPEVPPELSPPGGDSFNALPEVPVDQVPRR